MDTPIKPKAKRTKACEYCKKNHFSCSDERPCTRCVHSGKPDQCVDVPRKKRKTRREIEQLELQAASALSSPLNSYSPGSTETDSSDFTASVLEDLLSEPLCLNLPTELDIRAARTQAVIKHLQFVGMPEKEARQCVDTVISLEERKNRFKMSLNSDQLIEYEQQRERMKQNFIRSVSENHVPTIFKEEMTFLCFNKAFKKLTGVPEDAINNMTERLTMFHQPVETLRAVLWAQCNMSGTDVNVPGSIRMWTNNQNYKTKEIDGKQYLEGTYWITKHVDDQGFYQFTTISFMPAPHTFQ